MGPDLAHSLASGHGQEVEGQEELLLAEVVRRAVNSTQGP
jgi:hypothetical protein